MIVPDDSLIAKLFWQSQIGVLCSASIIQFRIMKNKCFGNIHQRMKVRWNKKIEIAEIIQCSNDWSCRIHDIGTIGGETNGYVIGAHG